jgi:hypothetical protein
LGTRFINSPVVPQPTSATVGQVSRRTGFVWNVRFSAVRQEVRGKVELTRWDVAPKG